jgi:hypothetical protein
MAKELGCANEHDENPPIISGGGVAGYFLMVNILHIH